MATRDARLKIAIEGEQAYKQALSELNKGTAVLNSEMKKLSAEYKDNENSTEALTKKSDLLQRQLLQQREKVETLRGALAHAAQEFGEADKRTQDWQIKLNQAEAAQADLEHAIAENNKELQDQGKITLTVGDAVDQLASKLGINLPKGATDALNGTVKFSTGTVAAMGAAAGAVAALIEVIKQLHSITLEAAADVDELVTESMVTGLSTQTIQQLKYAENLIDVSYSTISGTLTKLTKNMADARDGNENLAAAFQALGVAITDTATGQLLPAEDVFYAVIDALGSIENGTERDAAAMELLGKSAQDLNPLILQGSDALRELAAEAEATGYVLDASQIQKLGEVDDAHQRFILTVDAEKKKLSAEYAPAATAAMDTFSHAVATAGDALVESHLIENTAQLISNTFKLVDAGLSLASKIPTWLNPLDNLNRQFEVLNRTIKTTRDLLGIKDEQVGYGGLGSDIAGAVWKNDVQAWVSAGGTIIGDWNYNNFDKSTGKLLSELSSGYTGDVVSYGQMSEDQLRRLIGRNAAGSQNWRGGLTWVGEAGPEIVSLPQGSRIYSNQESRQLVGGDTYNITVANIRELDEIVDWYQSRRIRERMG